MQSENSDRRPGTFASTPAAATSTFCKSSTRSNCDRTTRLHSRHYYYGRRASPAIRKGKPMKRYALALLAFLITLPMVAEAQALKYNCTTTGCSWVADVVPPPAVQPAQCRFIQCGAGSTIATCNSPVTKNITPPVGAVGALSCSWPNQVFAAGTYFVTSTALASDGSESGFSNIVNFTSSAGAPPALGNLRTTAPVVP